MPHEEVNCMSVCGSLELVLSMGFSVFLMIQLRHIL